MLVETRLKTYQQLVDKRLSELLPSDRTEPKDLHSAMRYSCLAPGKRLRPALCIASAEAIGIHRDRIDPLVQAGCALEMVHCFSLIHDDMPCIDDDDLRRGVPTCHMVYGEALALLAGDALFALAFESLSSTLGPADRVLRAVQTLSRASGSGGLVGGEVLDVISEGKSADEVVLMEIHSRKTGALIAASCEIGGLLGGGDEAQVQALATFGEQIGLAFQIVDDILNETSTSENLGKAAGSDRDRKKLTYPAVHGLEESRTEAQRLLSDAISKLKDCFSNANALEELAAYSVERLH